MNKRSEKKRKTKRAPRAQRGGEACASTIRVQQGGEEDSDLSRLRRSAATSENTASENTAHGNLAHSNPAHGGLAHGNPAYGNLAYGNPVHEYTTHDSRAAQSLCPVSHKCGACSLIDVPYGEQLIQKQQLVAELFDGIAPEYAIIEPVLGMDEPYHYRAKVTSPFAPGKKLPSRSMRPRDDGGVLQAGGWASRKDLAHEQASRKCGDREHASRKDLVHEQASRKCSALEQASRKKTKKGTQAPIKREILTGMYAAHTHKLIPTDECLLENAQAKAVILAIRKLMYRYDIAPYNEDTHTGFMRHAVVRVGHKSGEVLVTLVTNARTFPSSRSFCRELVKLCPFITTVVQNVNLRQTNVILGMEEHTLYGPGFILDTLCDLSFRISSSSFYQVNSTQTEVLYRSAIKLAQLTGKETAIDAYCGTGTIGLVAAKNGAARVIGVDSVASAIRDARQNAAHNGIKNAEFIAADAGDFMRELASGAKSSTQEQADGARCSTCKLASGAKSSTQEQADGAMFLTRQLTADATTSNTLNPARTVLFMDPPRAGASKDFLDAVCTLAPARIVYISCNPQTQARDAAYLARAGYVIQRIQPVDMFPHTDHVESVCLLSKLHEAKHHVNVTVDMDVHR